MNSAKYHSAIQFYKTRAKTVCLFVLLFFAQSVFSQNTLDANFSSLLVGADYCTNNSLNGNTSIYATQPVSTVYSSYYHKSGFNASFVFSNIANSDESNEKATQEYGLSLGYDMDFTEWLMASASYHHYFYSKNSYSLKSNYKDLYHLGMTTQVGWWLSGLDLGYFSGKANDMFVSLETGVEININNVLKKDNTLTLQPTVSLYASSINYYNENAYKNYYFLYSYSQSNPELTVEELLSYMENPQSPEQRIVKRILTNRPYYYTKVKELPLDLVISDLFKEQSSFAISSIGFSLPVYYQWGNMLINLGFSVYKPLNQPSYTEDSWTAFSNVGLTYLLPW